MDQRPVGVVELDALVRLEVAAHCRTEPIGLVDVGLVREGDGTAKPGVARCPTNAAQPITHNPVASVVDGAFGLWTHRDAFPRSVQRAPGIQGEYSRRPSHDGRRAATVRYGDSRFDDGPRDLPFARHGQI